MTFSNKVKMEIIENKPLRVRFRKAQACGLFAYARRSKKDILSIRTESRETAELFVQFARDIGGQEIRIREEEQQRRGKVLYTAWIPGEENQAALLKAIGDRESLLKTPDEVQAFISGAYLACGNLTDPKKSYHLEFVVKDLTLSALLFGLLDTVVPGVKRSMRRGDHILYYKDCVQIEDMLAIMGASKASLAMIEVEIIKEVRNKANRVTNCETANIDKLVAASTGQIQDIQYILEQKGKSYLPEPLRQAAVVRLAHPELSLRQLAEEMPVAISRSGMHHRLDKLSRIAKQLREEQSHREDESNV